MTTDADVAHTIAPLAEPLAGAGTVGGMVLAAADRHHGDALTAPGRQPVSYAGLGRAVREIAGGLAALSIERGGPRRDPRQHSAGMDAGRPGHAVRGRHRRPDLPDQLP